jgi:hydroxymethylpyrimidine kinase/phosphomethylpyrimidine kinase/thiamine-phosphate diphosphorylase
MSRDADTPNDAPRAVVWSVAGTDSGGGAGLAADQRAAEACGVHLCPVVAAVTAQNPSAVTRLAALDPALLDAQLAALADELPPAAIKTGLLGSAANARVLARWVDRLRARSGGGAPALVIDPVLRASTGAELADAALLAAYRDELLPRATVLTPNRAEAARLLGGGELDVPAQAAALRARGAAAVCITGGDAGGALALDWLDTPQARGWLSLPRVATRHHHGTGCTFASALAAAAARGFVGADAAVLAKMATTHALRRAVPLGESPGAGPVRAGEGFASDPTLLPHLSCDENAPAAWPLPAAPQPPAPGVYAIVDSAERVQAVLAAGARTVQLRIKQAPVDAALREALRASIAAAAACGATLVVNDHWSLALELGAGAVHLGQEDLLRLSPAERARLRTAQARGLQLGLSSHSLWELACAAAWSPAYIACGPVWPTTTKAMPWRAQGLHNLAWWAHMAPAPVVAIGGILEPRQLRAAAASGARGGCVVRGLGADPAGTLPHFEAAWQAGCRERAGRVVAAPPGWPQPTLAPEAARPGSGELC